MSNATEAADLGNRLPTQDEIACAAQAVTALAHARGGNAVLAIHREDGEAVRLEPAIADLVLDILSGVASGHAVTLVPAGAMLTRQQAADILSVSRPHLSKLLKSGKIPFVSVGAPHARGGAPSAWQASARAWEGPVGYGGKRVIRTKAGVATGSA